MNIELALLAVVQLAKLSNTLLKEYQSGLMTDEQFLERYRTEIVPFVQRADERWRKAGETTEKPQ